MVPPPPNLKGWIPLKVFSVLIIPPVWYPGVPPQPKGFNPLEGFLSVDHFSCMVSWCFPPPPNLKGWIPLKGLSVLIIPPVWYPDGSPPTQPKGLNPLEGFLSVDHSACMVPWWFPPTQPKGLNPLEGFLSVDHSACMVPWWFPPHPT